jgi:hypothetical protein
MRRHIAKDRDLLFDVAFDFRFVQSDGCGQRHIERSVLLETYGESQLLSVGCV